MGSLFRLAMVSTALPPAWFAVTLEAPRLFTLSIAFCFGFLQKKRIILVTRIASEEAILDRLADARIATPVGSRWRHVKSDTVYAVQDHIVEESDLSIRVV